MNYVRIIGAFCSCNDRFTRQFEEMKKYQILIINKVPSSLKVNGSTGNATIANQIFLAI
jgi:hypothetical protein